MSAASELQATTGDEAAANSYEGFGLTAEDYEFGAHLGDGGFARVYQATCRRTGRPVAIKVLDKRKIHQRNMSSRVVNEISIHQRLSHPFILQLYSYFEDSTNVYLVLELCQRGNLHDYVKHNGRLNEDKVRYFLKQIVTGVRYLHQNRILHRDLTLTNLLLTEDSKVKISDFGLATELTEDRTNKTMCGTPNYISPEVSSQGVQGLEVDVWSMGVMLYTMLVGKAPFDTKDPRSTIDNARRLKYDIPGSLQPEAIDLIAKLLRERPKDRLTLGQILEHPFMRRAHERSASNDSGNDSASHSASHCLIALAATSTPVSAAETGNQAAATSAVSTASHRADSASGLHSSPRQEEEPQPQPQPTPHPLAASTGLRRCHSDGRTGTSQCHRSEGYASAVQSEGSPTAGLPLPLRPTMSLRPPSSSRLGETPRGRETGGGASSSVSSSVDSRRRQQQQLPVPLTTERLEPCRIAKGLAVFTLSRDGSVTVEQLRAATRGRPARALRIQANGRTVHFIGNSLGKSRGEQGCRKSDSDANNNNRQLDWSTAEEFVHPDLPEAAARLYHIADSFVSILRSNTAKIVLHTERARCVLYENQPEPDFAVHFYDGRRAARRDGGRRITVDGRSLELRSLSQADAEIVHYVNETYDQILRLEAALSAVSSPGRPCFPATIGRPPGLEPSTSAAAAAVPVASPRARPDQLQVADVQQLSDSDSRVLFSDGSLLEIRQDSGSELQRLDFTDPFGHRQCFESSERRRLAEAPLPEAVQRRLGLLLSSPARLAASGCALPACFCCS